MLIRVLLQCLALSGELNDVECYRELVLQPNHPIGYDGQHAYVVAPPGRVYEKGHNHLSLKHWKQQEV